MAAFVLPQHVARSFPAEITRAARRQRDLHTAACRWVSWSWNSPLLVNVVFITSCLIKSKTRVI